MYGFIESRGHKIVLLDYRVCLIETTRLIIVTIIVVLFINPFKLMSVHYVFSSTRVISSCIIMLFELLGKGEGLCGGVKSGDILVLLLVVGTRGGIIQK